MPTTLILVMVGLSFLLIALVFIYVWIGRSRKSITNDVKAPETFESLSAIIKAPSSTNADLRRASELILKDFGTVTRHTFHHYRDLIETLCIHPHTDSKIILNFEKSLRSINPNFNEEIEHALRLGLVARDSKG